MKVCSKCNIGKEDSEFRIRIEVKCKYLNNTCRQCDAELANIYYHNRKNDPEFRKKNCDRVKIYREANYENIRMRHSTKEYAKKHAHWALNRYYRMKDIVAVKMKDKRQTEDYKAKMHKYREQKKEKIYQQEVITKKRYHEKNRDTISDRYIVNLLRTQGYGNPNDLIKEKELLETYRIHIKLKRLILCNQKQSQI